MDEIDRKLLILAQKSFPVTTRPYAALGEKLGIGENEVIFKLKRLKQEGLIRRVGAVFDSGKLGYVSALCAIRADESEIDELAAIINKHPGVTHNYQRDNQVLNLWFTLTCTDEREFAEVFDELQQQLGRKIHCFPALRRYKIKFYLPFTSAEVGDELKGKGGL